MPAEYILLMRLIAFGHIVTACNMHAVEAQEILHCMRGQWLNSSNEVASYLPFQLSSIYLTVFTLLNRLTQSSLCIYGITIVMRVLMDCMLTHGLNVLYVKYISLHSHRWMII